MSGYTEADIRAGAASQSYQRGAQYYRAGYVSQLARRGNLLTAQVEGSTFPYYQVSVTLAAAGGIADASCTCPYDWGGYCKHIVAVLLSGLHNTGVVVKPDLETLLTPLTEKQLRRVLQSLAEGRPGLIDDIERAVQRLTQEPAVDGSAAGVAHAIPVDLAAIRREIGKDLRMFEQSGGGGRGGYYEYWDDEAGTIYPEEVLGPHQVRAEQLLDAGDAAAAASVIAAVVEAWGEGISDLDEWIYEANEDAFSEAGQELSLLLAEALLSMDLTPEQRKQWYARAEDWEDGIDLEILETALDQWWDYPPLVAAMQGNISEKGAWEGEAPRYADELTLARLRILQRQGRIEEYVHLAEAEGQTSLYINMLARSGQVERAVTEAQQYLVLPAEALSLAQALVEQAEPTAALTVAAYGLGLTEHGDRRELAHWTVAQAEQAGDRALALRAAQVAFLSGLALDDYKAAERLAGAEWPTLKTGLLAQIGEPGVRGNPLDLYLYEQMWVEAMALIDRSPWGGDLQRVIEATRAQYPDWGIQHCKRQAESIMDAKKAKDYDRAVEWLRIARDIFRQHHREAEWQAYLRSLLALHERKYKLVPMLRAIMT
jgi:uncharacterized Zn finger protein